MGPPAPRDGLHSEGEGRGGPDVDALLEQSLPPAPGHHPLGGGGRGDHQEGRDEAAREGDNLQ